MTAAAELRAEPKACDPRTVAEALGLEKITKVKTTAVRVCCVWHPDRDPSLSIRVAPKDSTLQARCFTCGKGGDVFNLTCQTLGVDHVGALEWLASFTGRYDLAPSRRKELYEAKYPETRNGGDRKSDRAKSDRQLDDLIPASFTRATAETLGVGLSVVEKPALDPALVHDVIAAVMEAAELRKQPDGCAFLKARHLLAEGEAVGLGALPPPSEARVFWAPIIERFGADVLGKLTLTWRADHRLLIPWRDRAGRNLNLQRRDLRPEQHRDKYSYLALPTPTEPYLADLFDAQCKFFNAGGIVPAVAFTEGALDALSYRVAVRRGLVEDDRIVLGLPSAASKWDPAWTAYARGRHVFLAFDADAAGDRFEEVATTALEGVALSVTRERPNRGKDVGEALVMGTQ